MTDMQTKEQGSGNQPGNVLWGAARSLAFAATLTMPLVGGGCSTSSGPEDGVQAERVEQELRAGRVLTNDHIDLIVDRCDALLQAKLLSIDPRELQHLPPGSSLGDVLGVVDREFLESMRNLQELTLLHDSEKLGIKHEMELLYCYADAAERVEGGTGRAVLGAERQQELLKISELLFTELKAVEEQYSARGDREFSQELKEYGATLEELGDRSGSLLSGADEATLMKTYAWCWSRAVVYTEAPYFEGYDLIAEAFPEGQGSSG
jgi:hypothetical protein